MVLIVFFYNSVFFPEVFLERKLGRQEGHPRCWGKPAGSTEESSRWRSVHSQQLPATRQSTADAFGERERTWTQVSSATFVEIFNESLTICTGAR